MDDVTKVDVTEETTETVDTNVDTETKETETDAEVIEKSLLDTDPDSIEDEEKSDDTDKGDADDDGSEVVYEKPDISDLLGEGAEFDTELFDKVTPTLKKLNASQEDVNEITRTYAEHVKNAAENHSKMLIDRYNEIKEEWKTESMTEFKGNFKETLKLSGTAIKKFGDQELLDHLNDTGSSNHKAVIRAFAKIGKYFAEDSVVDGEAQVDTKAEDVLYPSMN